MKRTVDCGSLRKSDSGNIVVLNGWIHRKRDHGALTFINIRDRYGITQVVADSDNSPELLSVVGALHNEFCVAVEGTVRERPAEMVNPDMATGEIEVVARRILILNQSETLPFQIEDESAAKEETRLRYRYLDLRSAGMQRRIALRSAVAFAAREWLTGQGFYEIETPTLIKSTPEGARDYLVPSRLSPGNFYALPQSPQLYKQLLMVSGFDKYFQIARCYRDEDARGDRQPEFTQIDIEMSFVDRDDVLRVGEGLMQHIFKKCLNVNLSASFPRIPWEEAMDRYGTDKPDLRFDMPLQEFRNFAEKSGFSAFKDALAEGAVKALVAPGLATYSRKQIEELESHAKIYKAKTFAWMKVSGGQPALEGGASKFFTDQAPEIIQNLGAKPGDLILMVADCRKQVALTSLGAVRSKLGHDLNLYQPETFAFAWIVDFPLFEFNEEENRWEAAHHLFSYPQEPFHAAMERDPGAVKGDLYDLVLNGYELASGSIRIHDPELQKRVFKTAGIEEEEAQKRFGFLTDALKFGAPPHGGIAPGLDRLVMLMAGQHSIKEVIAFPKNSFAESPMDECPSPVDQKQLDELHLVISKD
ncbi:aspartate--tRNA(Asp/Asn) ligase [Spirochaetia bacterium]|nr:aspartate--tRNA(Asp/Asn) ligase [Spirochaetia bacterium]GHU36612.1 aspartate--tRNA(Asp/Asn) ligase [Spirochaetia bacterium]